MQFYLKCELKSHYMVAEEYNALTFMQFIQLQEHEWGQLNK